MFWYDLVQEKSKEVSDKPKKQTFTDGVSSLYAETNDVAGSWDFLESSVSSSEFSSSLSSDSVSKGCARPSSKLALS